MRKYPRTSNGAEFVEMVDGRRLRAVGGFYFNASGRLVKLVKRENSFSKVFS